MSGEGCERHTEHAIRPGEGLVGRYFDYAGRSYWDWCDTEDSARIAAAALALSRAKRTG